MIRKDYTFSNKDKLLLKKDKDDRWNLSENPVESSYLSFVPTYYMAKNFQFHDGDHIGSDLSFDLIPMGFDHLRVGVKDHDYSDASYGQLDGPDELNTESPAGPRGETIHRTRKEYGKSLPELSYEKSFFEVGGEGYIFKWFGDTERIVKEKHAIAAAEHYKDAHVAEMKEEIERLNEYKNRKIEDTEKFVQIVNFLNQAHRNMSAADKLKRLNQIIHTLPL